MKSKVFFLHIPKCAGQSVWKALRDIYGDSNCMQIAYYADFEKLKAMSPTDLQKFSVIGGHRSMAVYRNLLGDLSEYYSFCIFREPIERLISNYNFVRKLPHHPDYEKSRHEAFEEYARRKPPNLMTRVLCGAPDADKALEVVERELDDWCLLPNVQDFIKGLYLRAGRRPSNKDFWQNSSSPSVTINTIKPSLMAELREREAADVQLYETLQKLRPPKIASRPSWFRRLLPFASPARMAEQP